MPYLMVDDEYPEHPKVDELSDGAFRLQTSAMAYCARKLTDGLVSERKVPRLVPSYKPAQLAELLAAGLWHRGGHGCGTDTCPKGEAGSYVVHDYLQWNRPRAWWLARREEERTRKAAYRARVAAEAKAGRTRAHNGTARAPVSR